MARPNQIATGFKKTFASILGVSALAGIGAVLLAAPAARAQSYLHQTLHSFTGADGQNPGYGHLIADTSGNLYGTTVAGGANGVGVVFELVKSGATYSETVLHSFTTSGGDGENPNAGVIMDSSGNLYGTTVSGGANGNGTVFELAAPLSAGMGDVVLHSFSGTPDGANPYSGLIMDSSGNLYGTTAHGGVGTGNPGSGTVFELVKSGATYTETVLHSFTNSGGDGFNPTAGLIIDSSGNLYGTTGGGGSGGFAAGGTVFELAAPLTAGMPDIVLHSFPNLPGGGDGAVPYSGVIMDSRGNLYGTTVVGGAYRPGTVYELAAPLSAGMGDVVLHSFSDTPDGADPYGGLIMDGSGNLYGTTAGGGPRTSSTEATGTVFELVNNSGTYTEKILKDFVPGCGADGTYPGAGLTMDSSGNLYGTTTAGGANGLGTVFELVLYSGPAYATNTSLTSSVNPATAGSIVFLTATVTSPSGYVPSGTVTFSSGALVVGSAATLCGVAVLEIGSADILGVGNVTLAAQYTPDSAAFASSSGPYNETVSEPGAVLTSGNNTLNGNQTINGTVTTAGTGSGFFGNGSGLTNLNPASLSAGTAGINITGNAGSATTAGSALTAATATNASQLGGIAAANYARLDAANSFAGNQTVTGTASVSGAVTAGTLAIGGGAPITEHLSKTFSVTVPSIPPNSCSTLTSLSLPGASDGDTIALGIPSALVAGTSGDVLVFFGYVVSGGNAVSIRVCNPHGGSASTSASGSIRVDIWKH